MLHVANHHVVPGKKQWTWGNGDFGQAWDRQLTDEDGPYIELMCGAYTDNQPDFSWIMPGEEKRFTQIFMPYKQIGPASNANREVVLNLEVDGENAQIGVYTTCPRSATIRLKWQGETVFETTRGLDPENTFKDSVAVKGLGHPSELTLSVSEGSLELIALHPLPDEQPRSPPLPAAAKPPLRDRIQRGALP